MRLNTVKMGVLNGLLQVMVIRVKLRFKCKSTEITGNKRFKTVNLSLFPF